MKRLNLNPTGRTVYKISQPGVEAARQKFTIEPMRFIPHSCSCSLCSRIARAKRVNNGERNER
jgi:hypothetical protein